MKLPRFIRNLLVTAGILLGSFLISLKLQQALLIEEHITTLFVFAVFLISLFTGRYGWGIAAAFLSRSVRSLSVYVYEYRTRAGVRRFDDRRNVG